jgi:hypothetical protein
MAILAVGQMNIIIECAFGQLVLQNIFSLGISNLKLSRSIQVMRREQQTSSI